MHDQPRPSEDEQEQGPERRREEDAMRAPGHDDPEAALTEEEAEE